MIRKLLPILGITFIDIVGFSILIPIMPYFVTHFGVSPLVVGILFSTFSFCQFVSAPIWGNISDRIGRKGVLIISQIGATIGWGMLAFAGSIFWVFVARIVEGVSGGNISITQAYVADLVEPKDRARAFGLVGAMFGLGMVFGPLFGGILFSRFGFSAPFLAAAGLQFVTLLVTIVGLPESRSKSEEEKSRVGLRQIFASFGNPRIAPTLWQRLALALGLYAWFSVIALFLKGQLDFSLTQTYYYFSAFAGINVAVNGFGVGRVSTGMGDRTMSNLGLGLLVVAFALVFTVHNLFMLTVVMITFAVGMAFANTGITALISNAATDRDQGTVLGTASSLDSLAGILAPPASTGILARFGPEFSGIVSAIFCLVALLMGLTNKRSESGPMHGSPEIAVTPP
jgi:DHA1 family tetracycline resistance protein-like MFS transporter